MSYTSILVHNQAQHHARKSFDDELKMILKRHGIAPWENDSAVPSGLGRTWLSTRHSAHAPCRATFSRACGAGGYLP